MEQLEIFIESLTGSVLQFHVSPFETVLSLKEKIQNLQGISVSHQHLIHADRVLDNESSLYNYNIQTGSTIRLIVHMRGGPISTRPLTADLTSQQTLLEEMATEYMESLTGDNWTSATDGGGSVASAVSGDSDNHEARASSATSAPPTPIPPSSKSHPRHVTLLVLRDGDQLNFYRVIDRTAVPNGQSSLAALDFSASRSSSAFGEDLLPKTPQEHSASNENSVAPGSMVFEPNRMNEQRVIENKTKQKMAELRSRMMANSRRVQIPDNAQPTSSNTNAPTPVIMPRPPSTSVHKSNAGRSSTNADASKPYYPTSSTLRRRRLPNQASSSMQISGSTPKGTVSSPRENSGGSFATLGDYFRSKEETTGTLASEMTDSPSPLPSPRQRSRQDMRFGSSNQSYQDVVRCSPYLKELFSGTKLFSEDAEASKKSESSSRVNAAKSTSMQLKSPKKPVIDSDHDEIMSGEPAIRQSTTSSTKDTDSFRNWINQETNQQISNSKNSEKSNKLESNKSFEGDADVLEQALTTLLLKAELEHLGTSRLPVNIGRQQSPSIVSNQPTKEVPVKDPTLSSVKKSYSNHASSSSTSRFGMRLNREKQTANLAVPSTGARQTSNNAKFRSPNANSSLEVSKLHASEVSPVTNTPLTVNTKLPAIASQPHPPARNTTATRCAVCNRRTGLATTYVCRCQVTFCSVHRYPETHQCTYDYKGEGRRVIQANNPVITAEKLPKI